MKPQNAKFKEAMADCLDGSGNVTRLEPLYNYIDQLEDAAEECHVALKLVLEKGKVGWIQQVAFTSISKALGKSPNDQAQRPAAKE